MLKLIRRARRRLLLNNLLSQGANATSAALAAFILLLLLGTEILQWHWLLAIPLAAAGAGLYTIRKRLPSPYRVAQIIDQRLGLQDTLSTAWFFSHAGENQGADAEIRRLQYDEAVRVSESVDVRRAVPFIVPKTAYTMLALVLVASSLFALRYGISRRLDLKQPLAAMLQQSFGFKTRTEVASNERHPQPPELEQQDESEAMAAQEQKLMGDKAGDADSTDSNEAQAVKDEKKAGNGSGDSNEEGNEADRQEEQGESTNGAEAQDGSSGQQGKKPDGNQSGKQNANQSGENSSLLSRMKDAMQNLLSRMKPQNQSSGRQQAQSAQNGKQQGKGEQKGSSQSARNGQQQGRQGQSQDGQSGEQGQESQQAQGQGTGKSDAQSSKQPGNGIGSQDGDKSLREAEQLAAMGKISEIIGKRSANVSGEVTVEVQSTSQQLRTPYARRGALHSQGGVEINRDEVPVALQSYVEQYFEQVRKQAPKK